MATVKPLPPWDRSRVAPLVRLRLDLHMAASASPAGIHVEVGQRAIVDSAAERVRAVAAQNIVCVQGSHTALFP